MAFVAQDFELEVAFADNSGAKVTRRYGVVSGTTYADLNTGLAAIISTIAATTDDLIVSYAIRSIWANDTITLPASGVENENQALLTLKLFNDPMHSGILTIPGAKPGIFVGTSGPNANVVDMADSAVTAFVGLFEDGGLLTVSDGQSVVLTGGKGKRRHSKNSNG